MNLYPLDSSLIFYAFNDFIVYILHLTKMRKHNFIVDCNSAKIENSFFLIADILYAELVRALILK